MTTTVRPLASNDAVAAAMKILARAFAGAVDRERVELYRAALEDIADDDLLRAVTIVVKTYAQPFIPPPAIIRRAIGADRPAAVDSDAVLREVNGLSHYSPSSGTVAPPVDVVRRHLGDMIAHAYALAGAGDVFSDNEITRDIARREFRKSITEAANTGGEFTVIGPKPGQSLLPGMAGLLGDGSR